MVLVGETGVSTTKEETTEKDQKKTKRKKQTIPPQPNQTKLKINKNTPKT